MIIMAFVKVATTREVKQGEGISVQANGLNIALFNVGGQFHAIDNACPHRGGPLGEGMLNGSVVTCPWHGWQFDVTTGKSPVMPAGVKVFEVKVEGEDVLVNV